ncbi:SdiA-regulated domain protein [Alicycliphilus denitrificans K601]|uniref:SdiA-regulated domain protein n=2 Tax=Alicycliphilus denitrificans TaxID=179636 RepID=F4GDP7_ALIDK|nr:SdiA-regulated domain protein [Alicycliphilus denitrificans K601]
MTNAMPLAQTSSRMPRCALLAALVVGAALGVYFQLPAMTYYWGQSLRQEAQLRPVSLWLPAYQATIQGRPLRGVEKNLSGLTFNNGTGTLFASTNSPAQIVELSVEGEVLRIIRVSGAQDTEGIAHVEGGRFMLSGGRHNALYAVDIGPDSREVQARELVRLPLDTLHSNLGVETVSWDESAQRLLVGQEKWPLRLLSLRGNPRVEPIWLRQDWGALFINDLASVTTHAPTGNLLLLSEESAMVVEYDPRGMPVSLLPLWRGLHGLARKIPQPEGLALAPDGSLFIVSEPNLFYRFEKPRAAARPGTLAGE